MRKQIRLPRSLIQNGERYKYLYLYFQGSKLLEGVRITDYNISVGMESCVIVEIRNLIIICQPPEEEPEKDVDDNSDDPVIMVIIVIILLYSETM